MPSLLDLTSQGDVGTISDESKLSSVTLMTPQQLYELWERQNWQSHTIDLTQDRRDWESMDEDLRRRLAWNLSSFFIGEERVTTQFSGLVMAYESQGEEAFLAAGAVLTKDLPARAVAMGVPARVVREVGEEDLLERWR